MFPIYIILFGLLQYILSAVIGVDYGTDQLVVGIVKPGMPFEIVTDFNSRRLSSSSISFYDNERLFGDDSLNIANRKPANSFLYIKHLVGKQLPLNKDSLYTKIKLPNTLKMNERGGIDIVLAEEYYNHTQFPLEFFITNIFNHVKTFSEFFSKDAIRDISVSIPSFFTPIHRRIVKDSIELNDLNLLSFIEENTAAGLQYGLDRVFENITHNILLINIGAMNTQINVVQYYTFMTDKLPIRNIKILSKVYHENIGSLYIDDILIREFIKSYKEKYPGFDIENNSRSYAKLRNTAKSTKKILSANDNMPVSIESIDGDHDLRIKNINRKSIIDNLAPVADTLNTLINKVLSKSNLTINDIHNVELIGGGTRVPAIQNIIKDITGKDVSFHINAEEAVALGSTFRGANCSKAFRVRNIYLYDHIIHDVMIQILNENDEELESSVLFPSGSYYDTKKVVSFQDCLNLKIKLTYNHENSYYNQLQIYNITNANHLCTQKYQNLTFLRMNLYFSLSFSGFITMDKADIDFEQILLVPETPAPPKPSDHKKFSKKSPSNETSTKPGPEKTENEYNEDNISNNTDGENGGNLTDNSLDFDENLDGPNDKLEKDQSIPPSTNDSEENKTSEDNSGMCTEECKPPEPKMVEKKIVRHIEVRLLEIENEDAVIQLLNITEKNYYRDLLKEIIKDERIKKELYKAKSDLEALIYKVRDQLDSVENIDIVSTEEQRETLRNYLLESEDWLFEDSKDIFSYKTRIQEIEKQVKPILIRAREYIDRPVSISKLQKYIESSTIKLADWKETRPQISEFEFNSTYDMINNVSEWLQNKTEEQNQLQAWDDLVLTVRDIKLKMSLLKERMKYLSKKRPLKPKVNNNNTNTTNQTNSQNGTDNNNNTDTDGVNSNDTINEERNDNIEKDSSMNDKEFDNLNDDNDDRKSDIDLEEEL